MTTIKIHVLHTGKVCVSPYLPFGGNCSILKASGLTTPKKDWIWLPVSAYLIEQPKGQILVDCGWSRDISPRGIFETKAQIKALGSPLLYLINQAFVGHGETVTEQFEEKGIKVADIDYLLLTHLDCDHVQGLHALTEAKQILVSRTEMEFATNGSLINRIRYQPKWWKEANLTLFDWTGKEGFYQIGRAHV